TEQEFRQIFQARKAVDDEVMKARLASTGDFEVLPDNVNQLQHQLASELQQMLGPQRYEDYERSRSGTYTTSLQFAQENGLPEDTARKLYEIRRDAAESYKRQIIDPALSEDSRQEALAALQESVLKQVQQTLNTDSFNKYQTAGLANWIFNIGKGVVPAPLKP